MYKHYCKKRRDFNLLLLMLYSRIQEIYAVNGNGINNTYSVLKEKKTKSPHLITIIMLFILCEFGHKC